MFIGDHTLNSVQNKLRLCNKWRGYYNVGKLRKGRFYEWLRIHDIDDVQWWGCTSMHSNAQVSIMIEVDERFKMRPTLIDDDMRLV